MTGEATVQAIFDGAVSQGVRPDSAQGATADAIERVRVQQGVTAIPAAVREVWSLIGDRPAPWWTGEYASVRGRSLRGPLRALEAWSVEHLASVLTAQAGYDASRGTSQADWQSSVVHGDIGR